MPIAALIPHVGTPAPPAEPDGLDPAVPGSLTLTAASASSLTLTPATPDALVLTPASSTEL